MLYTVYRTVNLANGKYCWVTKEFKEKKIPGYNLNEYLKVGWHRGRKNFTRVVELADAPV